LNKILTENTLTVRLPNGQTMKSTHTATLDIPQLSRVAKAAHVFPAMENNSLLSVGQLCDEGYSFLFNTNGVKILNEKQEIIMKGSRDHATGLWRINLLQTNPTYNISQPPSQLHTVNNVYALRNSDALVKYLHKAIFSCKKSALVHATKKGHLTTWPGLTVEAVKKHLMLNYSHSRNPRVRPHGRTDKSKRPESHPTKECDHACARCLNTEPKY
jgi:hypothetical protein